MAFEATSPHSEVSAPVMYSEAEVELIWQMGLASLSSNNNELVLPNHIAKGLSEGNIEDLKLLLSGHLNGAPVIAFQDPEAQVFRVCRVPQLSKTGESPSSYYTPAASSDSPMSTTQHFEPKSADSGRKSKVPRPPNAFILYRKDRHPVLKSQNPDLHNNDISCILGHEWNSASSEIKAEYKARANRIKQQHAADNPGYQYAPRKPSEKKRRMTAKKLARMRNASAMHDVADNCRVDADVDLFSELESDFEIPSLSSTANLQTAEGYLGTQRPNHINHLDVNERGELQVTLPTNNDNLQREIREQTGQIDANTATPFDTANHGHVEAFVPTYVNNDEEFFNSLIDWEGIAADAAIVKASTAMELSELADLELGNPFLNLSEEDSRAAFQNELRRTMQFFE